MSVPASSNDSSYRVSSADTLPSGKNTKGLCAQDGNMPLQHSGGGGEGGELLCPTCGLPIETDSSICCDRCDIWYHMKCEQINLEMYALFDSSELGYTCLACTHEVQCEDLTESLCTDHRDVLEACPLSDDEETHKKEGYEPEAVPPVECGRVLSLGTPIEAPSPTNSSKADILLPGMRDHSNSMAAEVTATLSNVHKEKKKGPNITDCASSSNNDANSENKSACSKPNRKGGRSKIKETEQEEQLKLQRSVIMNLERKLGEIENSNKILRQEVHLFRSNNEKTSNDGTYQMSHGPSRADTNQTYQHHNNGSNPRHYDSQEPNDCVNFFNSITQMKEQIRNMDFELMKHRISNIEASLLQQQRLLSMPHHSIHPAVNCFGTAMHGFGLNPFQQHPWAQFPVSYMHPQTYPTMQYGTHLNPMNYQGYPIISLEQAQVRQYPNPSRVNLPFRSEQMAQNPVQGNPVGFVPQVQRPNRQTQVQKNLKRADLEFRTENYAYNPSGDDSSATRRPNGGSVNRATGPAYNPTVESGSAISKPSERHVTSAVGPVAPHIENNNGVNSTRKTEPHERGTTLCTDSADAIGDSYPPVLTLDSNTIDLRTDAVSDVDDSTVLPQEVGAHLGASTVCVRGTDTERLPCPVATGSNADISSHNRADIKKSFLWSGRASESTWKRKSC